MCRFATKSEIVKILHFKQFYKHYVINEDGTEGTEKELIRYGVKFSVMKDKENRKYSVFFQAKDMKVMEKAFKHALSESERKESIHKNIEKFKEMAKNTVSKDKVKNKQKE